MGSRVSRQDMCLSDIFLAAVGCWQGGALHQVGAWVIGFPVCVQGASDEEFAAALYHFNHCLVTSDLQSPNLQVCVHDPARARGPLCLLSVFLWLRSSLSWDPIPGKSVERLR